MSTRSERKRTPERLAAICKMVQKGLTMRRAAEQLHIHHSTVNQWRKELPDFDAALAAAEAAFIKEQLANICLAAKTSWQASAWLLERKFPSEFSQPQIQLHHGVVKVEFEDFGGILKTIHDSPEALRALQSMTGSFRRLAIEAEIVAPNPSSQTSEQDSQ
jgi:transposase-like protein